MELVRDKYQKNSRTDCEIIIFTKIIGIFSAILSP